MTQPVPTLSTQRDREFPFTKENFEEIRKIIYARAGISLAHNRIELVYNRLAKRLRVLQLRSFDEYLGLLDQPSHPEWEEFTNGLTTNLTSFFREAHHFPVLAEQLRKLGRARPIVIWCSAASTGEEPYSIAMTAVEAFDSWNPPVQIIASDIDTKVLDKAGAGIYEMERIESLSLARRQRFFLRGKGGNAGVIKVRPELRALIEFQQINLLDKGWMLPGPLDVIFCRNVMIYFDKETQTRILQKFVPLLHAKGLLYAGHSENFVDLIPNLILKGKTVYGLKS